MISGAARRVAFLDPFGMQVPWATIEGIARRTELEVILNFPMYMATQRLVKKGATFSAADMLARGFLSRVVADDMVASDALGSAQRVAALAPQAARLNKQTLRALKTPSALDSKEFYAIENIVNGAPDPYGYANSAEHREGITAFLDKRPPVF